MSTVVVIGGTGGLGREVARHYLDRGREVVISGRDPDRTAAVVQSRADDRRVLLLSRQLPEAQQGKGAALNAVQIAEILIRDHI